MQGYIGENTKTKYLHVINRINIFHILYLILLEITLSSFIFLLIKYGISNDNIFLNNMSYILIFILMIIFLISIVFIVAKLIIIIRNHKIIKYYLSNELTNIQVVMINYDYKLWLTAPKDTFHPMSFNINKNDKIETYKTGIYFTNSEKYNHILKFKMPKSLIARSYINYYANVGYDDKHQEMIIIDLIHKTL